MRSRTMRSSRSSVAFDEDRQGALVAVAGGVQHFLVGRGRVFMAESLFPYTGTRAEHSRQGSSAPQKHDAPEGRPPGRRIGLFRRSLARFLPGAALLVAIFRSCRRKLCAPDSPLFGATGDRRQKSPALGRAGTCHIRT